MVPCGHQIIPRPLRGRAGENGRRDFQEIVLCHALSDLRHDFAAKHDFLFHFGIAQIQIPVFEPGGLVRLPGTVHLKGKLIVNALAKHRDILRNHLHLAGRDLRILIGTLPHGSGDGKGGFVVDAV